MNVCIDTNVCLRFLIGDDDKKLTSTKQFFESAQQGELRLYISSIVLLEIYWVLSSLYKYSKRQAQNALQKIMLIRNLVIVDSTDFRAAFVLHKKTGVKLADCLIATQVGKGIVLCTYDTEFKKFSFLTSAEPGDIVKKIHKFS